MTQTQIILIVVVIGAVISIVLALSGGGLRVTQIDRTIEKDEDRDDA